MIDDSDVRITPDPRPAASLVVPVGTTKPSARDLGSLLAAPFPAEEIDWKPQAVSGNRALAIAYIDARCVMDRLDAVLGVGGWSDRYDVLPDGCVVCTLSVYLDGFWVVRTDVGGESDQKDGGDRRKASFSDALKRAAVKFGVGRYLYRLPSQWVDYDPQRRQFVRTPSLPAWALPQATPPASNGEAIHGTISRQQLVLVCSLCDKVGYGREDLQRDYGKTTRKALSKEEASRLIDTLQKRVATPTTNGKAV